MNMIGIDVDSKNLVCRIRRSGKDYPEAIFANDAAGHRKLISWATKGGKPARICMEATGVYSIPLAIALSADRRLEVMVMNPKAIKNFATAILQRGKTDSLDASTILEFVERMPFHRWHPPAQEVLEIQHINRRIVQLNVELTRERNRHQAAARLGRIGQVVVGCEVGSEGSRRRCGVSPLRRESPVFHVFKIEHGPCAVGPADGLRQFDGIEHLGFCCPHRGLLSSLGDLLNRRFQRNPTAESVGHRL